MLLVPEPTASVGPESTAPGPLRSPASGPAVPLGRLACLLVTVLLTGCVSRIIEHPGIRGRFLRQEDGRPLAGVVVLYRNMGDGFRRRTRTDAAGRFSFPAELTWAYTGFPTAPSTEGVELSLELRRRLNWIRPTYEVRSTDLKHAVIEAGAIRISPFFRGEGPIGDLGNGPAQAPP